MKKEIEWLTFHSWPTLDVDLCTLLGNSMTGGSLTESCSDKGTTLLADFLIRAANFMCPSSACFHITTMPCHLQNIAFTLHILARRDSPNPVLTLSSQVGMLQNNLSATGLSRGIPFLLPSEHQGTPLVYTPLSHVSGLAPLLSILLPCRTQYPKDL